MIKNSIEQLVYDLLKSNTSYSDSNGSSAEAAASNMPNTSKRLAEMEKGPEEKTLCLRDVKNLFLNL